MTRFAEESLRGPEDVVFVNMPNPFVKISKYIFPNCEMYLSKSLRLMELDKIC